MILTTASGFEELRFSCFSGLGFRALGVAIELFWGLGSSV